ncbi:alpha/beta hydrolase family protein [Herpetosiphon geysericola]|uniref:Platelet-activating factor acetylhydrolase plasma/intracellular n=1 Tax=Herpetosiphon geysericola TaxID=70996 RepID=A0A0P6Z2L6_9CHLR|nr:hypothetical protein [Herpetosiphon geysericola]KPL91459.1 hypothetical protein SE18_02075 [Herpetosiphon geysericola]
MRFLEWIACLAFLPALFLPFMPQPTRARWRLSTALLPAVVSLIQILLEGWRIQLLPLYGLASLVLLNQLLASSERRLRIISGISFVGLVLSIIGASWLLPVPSLPTPTGLYAVGIVDRVVVDSSRQRRLMVSVWYPAAYAGEPASLTKYPDQIAAGLGDMTGIPAFVFQHLRYITLAASEGVPMLSTAGPLPVLVFSPGMVGLRAQNSSTFQELASWGYLVVAIDHTDAAAVTVFPDGEVRFSNFAHFGIDPAQEVTTEQINQHVLPVWIADQRFVLDTLERWNANDSLLAGQLDLSHIGIFGHSFGGATALETCEVDARCKVVINLDGGLYGKSVERAATKPLLLITSQESSNLVTAVTNWNHLISNAQNQAVWLELPNSSHLSFTFAQLLSPLLAPDGFEPRQGLALVDSYVRMFLDGHLRSAGHEQFTNLAQRNEMHWLAK